MDPSPTPPLENLLAHRNWVRAVARRLVRDAHAADDLAQEAWVRALKNPPDPERDPRPWLGRVLRNLASNARRGEARRRRREDLRPRRPAARSPDVLVAEAEQHRRLVSLVLDLDEPFRGALLMRFYEGLTPSQIARQLGVPAGTVHSRIARAVERLRQRLDREENGDRRAWLAVLVPFADTAPAKSAAATSTLGVVLMTLGKHKLAAHLVAFLLCLGGGAMWWLDDGVGGDATPSPAPSLETADAPRLEPPDALRAEAAPSDARDRPAQTPATPSVVFGQVLDASGAPIDDAELVVLPANSPGIDDNEPGRDARLRVVRAGADGRFRLPVPAMDDPRLVVHAGGHIPTAISLAGRTPGEPIEIRLPAPRLLHVRVEGPDGSWPAGCSVHVRDRLRDSLERAADPARQEFWWDIDASEEDGPAEQIVNVTSRAPLMVSVSPPRGFAAVPPVRHLEAGEDEASFRIVASSHLDLTVVDAATGNAPPEGTSIAVWVGRLDSGATAWSTGGLANRHAFDSRLSPGTYFVEVRARGYERWSERVEIGDAGTRQALRAALRRRTADDARGTLVLRPVETGKVGSTVLALALADGVQPGQEDIDPYLVFVRLSEGDRKEWRETWNSDWAPTTVHVREGGAVDVSLALYSLQELSMPAGTYDIVVMQRATGRAGIVRGVQVFGDQENAYDVRLAPGTLFRLNDLVDRDVALRSLRVDAEGIEGLPMVSFVHDGNNTFSVPAEIPYLLETPRRGVILGPFPAGTIDVVVGDAKAKTLRFHVRGASTKR